MRPFTLPTASRGIWSMVLLLTTSSVPAVRAAPHSAVSPQALTQSVAVHRADVPEFQFIREQAKALGIRVWLFGGTAAGYGHYVKWDLQRKSGDARFQPDRFDYDYTNIYRSTQDADLVVDGTPEAAEKLAEALTQKFPHLQGSKSAWEVRLLKQAVGAKDALLGNPDYLNQHTDSNSTGMIELTDPPAGESVVRDLRDWKAPEPVFLKDLADGKLHYYFSASHPTTARAKAGDNPEIFSAVRLLTKAFQYELTLRPEDWKQVQEVIDRFDPKRDLTTPYSQAWLEKNAKKLIQHAVNIEYAWDTLEKLGLRKKLIALKNDATTEQSLAWWLSKEPLRDGALGTKGRTAREIFGASAPIVLAHETNSFLAYESITRAHTGDPNILISRNGHAGEAAAYGDGFYTRLGREGARDTGRTIRFTLDPNAREGEDFTRPVSDYIVILNKRAIRVIPESLNMSLVDYFRMIAEGKAIPASDRGILEKLKRRLNAKSHSLSGKDAEEIFAIVEAHLASQTKISDTLLAEFFALSPGIGQRARVDKIVDGLLSRNVRELDVLVATHVLKAAWSANRPDWFRHAFQSRYLIREEIIAQVLSLPHWRDQASVVDDAVRSGGAQAGKLWQEVLLPHWRAKPEFDGWVSMLLQGSGRDSVAASVATELLPHKESAKNPEWMEAVLAANNINQNWVLDHLLSLPHWRDQARIIRKAIELNYLPEALMTKVVIPHWQDRPEFSELIDAALKRENASDIAIAPLLSQPHYADRLDWLLALLRSPRINAAWMVEEVLAKPHWRGQLSVIESAIELQLGLPDLLKKVLIPYWQGRPEFDRLVSRSMSFSSDARAVVAGQLLTLPAYAGHLDWLQKVLEDRRLSDDWVVENLLAKPHWRDQPSVMRAVIHEEYGLSKVVEKILAPHWKDRPEFAGYLSEIVAKDHLARASVASHILPDPASAGHPEWFLKIVQSRHVNPLWVIQSLRKLPHWGNRPELIWAFIDRKQNLHLLLEEVLIPNWRNHPEFPDFISALLRAGDGNVALAITNQLLMNPESAAHPEWLVEVIRGGRVRQRDLIRIVLAAPHWRNALEPVRAAIQKNRYSSDETQALIAGILPHWQDRPELGFLLTDLMATICGAVHAQNHLVDPALTKHPEWLHAWIDGETGQLEWLYRNVLLQPHWRKHPEFPKLVGKLLRKSGSEVIAREVVGIPEAHGAVGPDCRLAIRRAFL